MKLGKFRQSKFGLMTAVCVLLTVLLIGMTGVFQSFDEIVQSMCQRMGVPCTTTKHVLMVYAPQAMLDKADDELIDLLNEIHRHGPRKIGLVANSDSRNFQRLEKLPFANQLSVGFRFDHLLRAVGGKVSSQYSTGFSDLHFSDNPVFRNGITQMELVGETVASLEAQLVGPLLDENEALPPSLFGVAWCGKPGSIARTSAAALMDGSSIRALIQGKVVLIGSDYPEEFSIPVPTHGGMARMSRLEVRANMVECLLQGTYTEPCRSLSSLFCLICVAFVSIQVARQTPIDWCGPMLLLLLLAVFAACFLCVWLTHVWLPASALLSTSLLSWTAITLHRFGRTDDFIQYWKLRALSHEAHFKNRFEKDVWKAIGDSAFQMFQPTRMILMELGDQQTHLKRVCSIGCDYSHILEKRLDYQRSPYFDALEKNVPIVNSRNNFFISTPGVREVEYILPLTSGLTTLGIVVLAMDKKRLQNWEDFQSFLTTFTHEMSQLVMASRREAEMDSRQTHLGRLFQSFPEELEFEEIQRNSEKQNDLIERADIAFDCSESAMATFDIYGRVIRRNSGFNRLVQEAQLPISHTSCVEIMAKLTGRSTDKCQSIFRAAIMDQTPEKLLIANAEESTADESNSPRVMYIKPMCLSEEGRRATIEMRGLLMEVVDGAPFGELMHWNNQLAESLFPAAIEDASQLAAKSSQLCESVQASATPQEALQNLFGSVGHTVDEIVSVLEQCKDITRKRVSADVANAFIIDSLNVWHGVQEKLTDRLLARSISIANSFNGLATDTSDEAHQAMANANPLLLTRVFETTIDLLLQNAFDDSVIHVLVDTSGDQVQWRFSNQGGGTPVDALRRSMEADAHCTNITKRGSNGLPNANLSPRQRDQLNEVAAWVQRWGGTVNVESQPDRMSIQIWMQKTNDSPPPITPNPLLPTQTANTVKA